MPHRLVREQWLDRPIDEVFEFFADAGNLEAITPPWLRFRILTPRPIPMASGTLIDYTLRVRGMPVRWRTEIVDWSPPLRFVDQQLRGPYRLWHHLHEFFDEGDRTRMVDTVDYELPLGPLGRFAHWAWVKNDLREIFDYRRMKIDEMFREMRSCAAAQRSG
jgi:ligand-binding SRPBCC domain-containing protein